MELFKRVGLPTALILSSLSVSLAAHADEEKRYIVQFDKGYKESVIANVKGLGGRVPLSIDRMDTLAIELTGGLLDRLKALPHVRFIEEDVKRYQLSASPYELGEITPYGIGMVQAEQLADLPELITAPVCIIDSGYDGGHIDLPHGTEVTGSDDPDGAGDWDYDNNGHGTHVAGTIAALGNNGQGVVGVLPAGGASSKLHIVKVFTAEGWAYSSTLTAALSECEAAGAKVVNMSLGGPFPSLTEKRAFDAAFESGILIIAAAGNDGNRRHSFPASYDAVVSVAAVDQDANVADFSQQTRQVELSAPGVAVLSSVPTGMGLYSGLSVSLVDYSNAAVDGSEQGSVTGPLVDCGLGDSACGEAGDICLIQRGEISFSDKALNCGGDAVVIYNNEAGMLYGTFGDVQTGKIAVGVSDSDGAMMLGQVGSEATVQVEAADYEYFNGTSMATPHVSAVAALVWSKVGDQCSNEEIREALSATALDLGDSGRDNAYGYGLIQAADAVEYLQQNPCGSDDDSLLDKIFGRIFG